MKFFSHLFLLATFSPTFGQVIFNQVVWQAQALGGGRITRFESTQIVPPYPTQPLTGAQARAVWPGIQNPGDSTADSVFQTVLADDDDWDANWVFYPIYCCDPLVNFNTPAMPAFPGDEITTTYTLINISDTTPQAKWELRAATAREGSPIWFGGMTFDPTLDTFNYTFAVLAIELQRGAGWDWGNTIWTNISISAQTNDQTWCTPVAEMPNGTVTVSPPTVIQSNGIVTCIIDSVTMVKE